MYKVSHIINSNGNPATNQFQISTPDGCMVFQSYETAIAMYDKNNQLVLDNNALNYSRTTSKYLYIFTQMNRKQLENGIKEGRILTQDLNK